jgi:hypothetical protein
MKYWPLTLRGTLVFLIALALMGTALPLSNPYGIILSTLLLAYLFITAGYILLFRFRLNGDKFQWSHRSGTAPWPIEKNGKSVGRNHIFLSMDETLPPLCIYHFTLKGKIFSGDQPLYGQIKVLAFHNQAQIAIQLPLPGIFHCRGRLGLSDLFGFVQTPLTKWHHREISFYPPLLAELDIPRPSSAEESEETVRTSPSNPERVFMRDYQPGDLARDINWKASGKFTAIYTRIAPDAADTTTKLTVVVRTNGLTAAGEPLRSALLLGLKSFSITLIGRLIKDYEESIIVVQAGGQTFSTEEEPLTERAIPYIAVMGWQNLESELVLPEPGALICTTTADRERVILREISPLGLYVTAARTIGADTPRGDLTYSLLKGNSLPLRPLIKAFKPSQLRSKNRTYSPVLPNGDPAPPTVREEESALYVEVTP